MNETLKYENINYKNKTEALKKIFLKKMGDGSKKLLQKITFKIDADCVLGTTLDALRCFSLNVKN